MRKIYNIIFIICLIISNSTFAKSKFEYKFIIHNTNDKKLNSALQNYKQQLKYQIETSKDLDHNYRKELIISDLNKLIKAYGYYDGTINVTSNDNYEIFFDLNLAQQYKLSKITYNFIGSQEDKSLDKFKPQANSPALIEKILDTQQKLYNAITAQNCLSDLKVEYVATLNNLTRTIDVEYNLYYGKQSIFGKININGAKNISPTYISKVSNIKAGKCFKKSDLLNAQLALQKTSLFSMVQVTQQNSKPNENIIDVNINLKEQAPHTIELGVNYSSDIGIGANISWENRNILSNGEKLKTQLSATPISQAFNTELSKPFLWRKDQTLTIGETLKQENTDAYKDRGIALYANIERVLENNWKPSLGINYEFSKVENITDSYEDTNYGLFSTPFKIHKYTQDDLLNPTKGWTIKLETLPYLNILDTNVTFIKSSLTGTYYHSFDIIGQPTLAFRSNIGTIDGTSISSVPSTIRFFSGGTTSVRGYAYQLLGPLDSNNKPIGGRSIFEESSELRLRFNDSFGMVTFLDGGNVFNNPKPDIAGKLRYGTGIGIRYFSKVGPLRLDVATPLNARQGVDASYQIYFSIGQAF